MDTRDIDDIVQQRIEGSTILGAFLATVEAAPDEVTLRWKDSGEWCELTWAGYRQQVAEVAAALSGLGLARDECVIMLSRPRPEPHIADLAVQAAGGVPVSLHTTLAPEQLVSVANHCEATVAVVENLAVLGQIRADIPSLRTIVVLDEPTDELPEGALTWAELRERGAKSVADPAAELAEAAAALTPESLATLIYTSGTTGEPKGVMISHRNVRWVLAAGFIDEEPAKGERFISFLPFSTVGGRFVDHWGHVVLGGAVVTFCPNPTDIWAYSREVHPTLLLGVPAVWEQLHKDLTAAIEREPDAKRRAVVLSCLDVGRQVTRLKSAGQEVPEALAARVEKVKPILRSVLGLVGLDQCNAGVSGGAAIDTETIEFFQALGLPMTQTWGMTELTTAVTGGGPNGTVGVPYPGVEIKLSDEGEVMVRGGLTMSGYYRDPVQTAEVLDAEGWLRTGDLGALDEDGNLRIVGRIKDIFVMANGSNVAPTPIELLLQRHPAVGQACLIGDKRRYVTALITVDPQWVGGEAASGAAVLGPGCEAPSGERFQAGADAVAAVRAAVDDVNTKVATHERIVGFELLPAAWTEASGELTPTLKKKRSVILERNAAAIARLYPES